MQAKISELKWDIIGDVRRILRVLFDVTTYFPYAEDYCCPNCGFDNEELLENPDNYGSQYSGKPVECHNFKRGSNLNGEWASWVEVVKCEKCGTIYKYSNGW